MKKFKKFEIPPVLNEVVFVETIKTRVQSILKEAQHLEKALKTVPNAEHEKEIKETLRFLEEEKDKCLNALTEHFNSITEKRNR